MKKSLLTVAMAIFATSAFTQKAYAVLEYNSVFPVEFSNGLPTGWTLGQESTSEKVAGGLKITCSQAAANYRGDLNYNVSEDASMFFNIDASKYKIFAIQFIGKRPESGVLKLSNIGLDPDGWIKGTEGYSLNESGWSDIEDLDGNHTYYWTVGGEKWTGDLTVKRMEIVIADIKNDADKSYTVAWMNWFTSADDLRASLNLKQETAVVNSRTNLGYATLKEAWDAALSGDVLKVNENQTVSNRLDCNERTLTIEGADGVKITRANASNMMFLANKGGDYNLTVKNLILNGEGAESTANFIEASGYSTVTLENIQVNNVKSSNALGLLVAKAGGKLVLNNVKTESCQVNDKTGEVFFGTSSSVISGDNSFTLSVENTNTFTVEGTLTNSKPITVYNFGGSFQSGNLLVNNCIDADKFQLAGTDLGLVAKDGNLYVSAGESSAVEAIDVDNSEAPVEYYNLQGVRVDNPEKGIYIMRQGTSVRKVIL